MDLDVSECKAVWSQMQEAGVIQDMIYLNKMWQNLWQKWQKLWKN